MDYKLSFTTSFLKKLKKFDRTFIDVIDKKINNMLMNPENKKNKLRDSKGLYKIRFDLPPYRVIYEVDGNKIIFLDIKHRDSVYKNLGRF